jgi:hypothetical protein
MTIFEIIGIIWIVVITGMLCYWALRKNKDLYKEI